MKFPKILCLSPFFLLFLGVVPVLCFYIGVKYQEVNGATPEELKVVSTGVLKKGMSITTLISSSTHEVSFVGKVVKEDYSLNYNGEENLELGRMQYLMLELPHPVNIQGYDGDEFYRGSYSNISKIQLGGSSSTLRSIANEEGHDIEVTGRLFYEYTAHHRTPVLIEVASVRKVTDF